MGTPSSCGASPDSGSCSPRGPRVRASAWPGKGRHPRSGQKPLSAACVLLASPLTGRGVWSWSAHSQPSLQGVWSGPGVRGGQACTWGAYFQQRRLSPGGPSLLVLSPDV